MAEGWYAGENPENPRSNYPPTTPASWSWPQMNAGVGTWTSAIGTGFSVIGQIVAANQQKKAADYNAKVAERQAQSAANAAEIEAQQHTRNALIAADDILLAKQAQEWQEKQQREQQESVASQTRAIVGASGLMMRGSPLAVYEHNLRQSERTILAGRYQAKLRERALQDQITMENYAADVARYGAEDRLRVGGQQAALQRYSGGQAQFAGTLGALGGLTSGVAQTYASYERDQARQAGTLLAPAKR